MAIPEEDIRKTINLLFSDRRLKEIEFDDPNSKLHIKVVSKNNKDNQELDKD